MERLKTGTPPRIRKYVTTYILHTPLLHTYIYTILYMYTLCMFLQYIHYTLYYTILYIYTLHTIYTILYTRILYYILYITHTIRVYYRSSINWDILEKQESDLPPPVFSTLNLERGVKMIDNLIVCAKTYTNEYTHQIG